MARRKTHKDVEFAVRVVKRDATVQAVFRSFDEAAGAAVAMATTGERVNIDVLVWSRSGARWFGGDAAVEQYDEDPDASVFERIEVKANVVGKIA